MTKFTQAIKYFFYVQKYFNSKQIYLIFFIYFIATAIEVLNIGIIIPFLNLIFYPESINNESSFLKFIPFKENITQMNTKYVLIGLIMFLFTLKTFFLVIAARIQVNFYAFMRNKITAYYYKLYISKPYIYYLDQKDSSIIIRNVNYVTNNYVSFLERFLMTVNDLVLFMGVVLFLFFYHPNIVTVMFVPLIGFCFIFYLLTKNLFYKIGKNLLTLNSDLLKVIKESLDNIIQIKLLKKHKYFQSHFENKCKENSYQIGNLNFYFSLPKIFLELICILVIFSIVIYLLVTQQNQSEIISILTIILIMTLRSIPAMNKLTYFINYYSSFVPNLEVLYIELKNNIDNINLEKPKQKFIKDLQNIKFENVSFKYKNKTGDVLKGINLNLEKNNIYGLCGDSGSGKTTLVHLITGQLNPYEGNILLNNLAISEIEQNCISYVSQSIYLQNCSLKQNIAFGTLDEEIDLEKINNSIELSNLKSMVKNLFMGIESNISELGANLSGGQIQRIAIARALYFQSNLIVFDEPTSSLDAENKKEIIETILRLKKDRIIIVISHDLNELKICDTIFKVKDKKVVKK